MYLNTFYKIKKDTLFNIKENGVFPLMFYKKTFMVVLFYLYNVFELLILKIKDTTWTQYCHIVTVTLLYTIIQ